MYMFVYILITQSSQKWNKIAVLTKRQSLKMNL